MATVSHLNVNGRVVQVDTDANRSLLDVLREDVGLVGVHYGCGEGKCGACTVLLDGEPARSCITMAGDVGNRAVTTIEGLTTDEHLHPVQQAFLDADVMQCGYCTPGMILTVAALLKRRPAATDTEIINALQGNLCRCGTYTRILEAVKLAQQSVRVG